MCLLCESVLLVLERAGPQNHASAANKRAPHHEGNRALSEGKLLPKRMLVVTVVVMSSATHGRSAGHGSVSSSSNSGDSSSSQHFSVRVVILGYEI